MSNLEITLPEGRFAAEGDERTPDPLVLVVVGARLACERVDRPLAYRLCHELADAIEGDGRDDLPRPIACTDLWYVHNQGLRERPAIAVGRPDHNAGTAYLASRLPPALVVEDRVRIHLHPLETEEAGTTTPAAIDACLWGTDDGATETALELFVERYLEAWVRRLDGHAMDA